MIGIISKLHNWSQKLTGLASTLMGDCLGVPGAVGLKEKKKNVSYIVY